MAQESPGETAHGEIPRLLPLLAERQRRETFKCEQGKIARIGLRRLVRLL